MSKRKPCYTLSSIVEKMNETYDGVIGDTFNMGVDRRVVPVITDSKISGWKIQQKINEDTWVDICEKVFNTMRELIDNLKNESCENCPLL